MSAQRLGVLAAIGLCACEAGTLSIVDEESSDPPVFDGGRFDASLSLDASGRDEGVVAPGAHDQGSPSLTDTGAADLTLPTNDAGGMADAGAPPDMGNACTPNCAGRQCGDDGCSGSCGRCAGDQTCTASGVCMAMATCGNGRLDPGERCDGDCPTRCASRGCTTRTLVGSAAQCDARCEEMTVAACVNGDGCCPSACDRGRDSDCSLDCTVLGSWPADWAAAENEALNEMNRHRSTGYMCASGPKMSVPAYAMNGQLRIAARCHSVDMAEGGFFSHTGSDGSRFTDRIGRTTYSGSPRYENIAAGNATARATVRQWMTSTTGHCDAVMASNANEVGIGYFPLSGTRYTHYWTSVMGSR